MGKYDYYLKTPHLEHSGIKGMKWGRRRYQNPDGSLTEAGRKRYGVGDGEDNKSNDKLTKLLIAQEKRIATEAEAKTRAQLDMLPKEELTRRALEYKQSIKNKQEVNNDSDTNDSGQKLLPTKALTTNGNKKSDYDGDSDQKLLPTKALTTNGNKNSDDDGDYEFHQTGGDKFRKTSNQDDFEEAKTSSSNKKPGKLDDYVDGDTEFHAEGADQFRKDAKSAKKAAKEADRTAAREEAKKQREAEKREREAEKNKRAEEKEKAENKREREEAAREKKQEEAEKERNSKKREKQAEKNKKAEEQAAQENKKTNAVSIEDFRTGANNVKGLADSSAGLARNIATLAKGKKDPKIESDLSKMSNKELNDWLIRADLENRYRNMNPSKTAVGAQKAADILNVVGSVAAVGASVATILMMFNKNK